MWKLLSYLLGWDYIYWDNFAASGIARVRLDALGNPYYFRYKAINCIDKIKAPEQVIWLTCHPDKYNLSSAAPPEKDQ